MITKFNKNQIPVISALPDDFFNEDGKINPEYIEGGGVDPDLFVPYVNTTDVPTKEGGAFVIPVNGTNEDVARVVEMSVADETRLIDVTNGTAIGGMTIKFNGDKPIAPIVPGPPNEDVLDVKYEEQNENGRVRGSIYSYSDATLVHELRPALNVTNELSLETKIAYGSEGHSYWLVLVNRRMPRGDMPTGTVQILWTSNSAGLDDLMSQQYSSNYTRVGGDVTNGWNVTTFEIPEGWVVTQANNGYVFSPGSWLPELITFTLKSGETVGIQEASSVDTSGCTVNLNTDSVPIFSMSNNSTMFLAVPENECMQWSIVYVSQEAYDTLQDLYNVTNYIWDFYKNELFIQPEPLTVGWNIQEILLPDNVILTEVYYEPKTTPDEFYSFSEAFIGYYSSDKVFHIGNGNFTTKAFVPDGQRLLVKEKSGPEHTVAYTSDIPVLGDYVSYVDGKSVPVKKDGALLIETEQGYKEAVKIVAGSTDNMSGILDVTVGTDVTNMTILFDTTNSPVRPDTAFWDGGNAGSGAKVLWQFGHIDTLIDGEFAIVYTELNWETRTSTVQIIYLHGDLQNFINTDFNGYIAGDITFIGTTNQGWNTDRFTFNPIEGQPHVIETNFLTRTKLYPENIPFWESVKIGYVEPNRLLIGDGTVPVKLDVPQNERVIVKSGDVEHTVAYTSDVLRPTIYNITDQFDFPSDARFIAELHLGVKEDGTMFDNQSMLIIRADDTTAIVQDLTITANRGFGSPIEKIVPFKTLTKRVD